MRLRFVPFVAASACAIGTFSGVLSACSGDSDEVVNDVVGPSPSVPRTPSPTPTDEPAPTDEPTPTDEPGASDDPDDPYGPEGVLDVDAGESSPVLKGTFEAASAACNEWLPDGADAIRSVPPHAGSFACRICSAGTQRTIALARTIGPLAAGSYMLSGWLGQRSDRPAPDRATAAIVAATSDGTLRASATVTIRRGYVFVSVPFTLPSAAAAIDVSFRAPADEGECLFIDDVFIVRHREAP